MKDMRFIVPTKPTPETRLLLQLMQQGHCDEALRQMSDIKLESGHKQLVELKAFLMVLFDRPEAAQFLADACKLNPRSVNLHYLQGRQALLDNDNEKAERAFRRCAEVNCKDVEANFYLGYMHSNRDDYERAIEYYSAAAKQDPFDALIFQQRAICYGQSGQNDLALNDFRRALRLDPEKADLYYSRGIFYALNDNLEDAIQDFSTAIDLEPRFCQAYLSRACAYEQLDRIADAEADIAMVKNLDVQSSDAYVCKALVHKSEHEDFAALYDLDKALSLDPSHMGALMERGRLMMDMEDYVLAEKDFDTALSVSQEPELLRLKATCLQKRGLTDEAFKLFAESVRRSA